MRSVGIIGAGPAGIVAAKTLLEIGEFEVTVYEKKSKLGGIWAIEKDSTDGYLSPNTPTNLSRFTVGFTDLDWNSVDFRSNSPQTYQNGSSEDPATAMFPKAWMAHKYLKEYARRFVPDGVIHSDREIVEVKRDGSKWRLRSQHKDGSEETSDFDFLIMASGFFSRPRLPEQNVTGLASGYAGLPVKMIHTSSFRELETLLPNDKDVSGKKILMIGGGNSSGETAAAIALQLSNAHWSPDQSRHSRYKDCKIIHVTPRPIYPLPPFVEYEQGSRSYVPIDFRLYDFSKRPKDLPSYAGKQAMEVRDMVHSALQSMVGSDLSDISETLVSPKGDRRRSVYVALSEGYAEHVRSGMISAISGRVTDVRRGKNGYATASVQQGDDSFDIEDIAAIVYATGYTPAPALDFLDDHTKDAVEYDSKSMRLPLILEQWQTMRKDADAISFLGFYEGPYWPMMEMQARLTAERWLSGNLAVQRPYEQQATLQQLRRSMDDRGLDVPQYWFGDYLGYLEDIADQLELTRNDQGFAKWEGCASPARHLSKHTDRKEADGIMTELYQVWHECLTEGKYIARAAFRALQGNWNISRRIDSAIPTFPSGTLKGTASFCPRHPTPDESGKTFDLEYLYMESGTFILSSGASISAKRRYVYRYSEADDSLSVWFVKPENDLEVDYLFHNLDFAKPAEAREAGALFATADHPCNKDMYYTEYRLPMNGVSLTKFDMKHTVKGPTKDYTATTQYVRPKR